MDNETNLIKTVPAANPAFNFMYVIEYKKPDGAIWYYAGEANGLGVPVSMKLMNMIEDAFKFTTKYNALFTRWQLFDKNDDIQIIEINF